MANDESAPSRLLKPGHQFSVVTLVSGVGCLARSIVRSRGFGRRRIRIMLVCSTIIFFDKSGFMGRRCCSTVLICCVVVIAGFFTGGALAVRGGLKAARNSAIGCACLLAVIEGVGIGFQRMMADGTRLDVRYSLTLSPLRYLLFFYLHQRSPANRYFRVGTTTPSTTTIREQRGSTCVILWGLLESILPP
jgi:hypothetical protein